MFEIDSQVSTLNPLPQSWLNSPCDQLGNSISLASLQVAWQLITDAVLVTDTEGRILFLNQAAERLTGWSLSDVQSQLASTLFQLTKAHTSTTIENPIELVLSTQKSLTRTNQLLLTSQNSTPIAIEYSAAPLFQGVNTLAGVVLVLKDKSFSLHLNQTSLEHQDTQDYLTGLTHHHAFEQYLESAILAAQTFNQTHVLCYLDLDHFKMINDACGYLAGDEFLRQVSMILQKRVRKTDVLARLGGDAFGLLLHQCTVEQAMGVAQALRDEVQQLKFAWHDQSFNCTLSAGMIVLNADCEGTASLITAADSACHVAKRRGGNRIHTYESTDRDAVIHRGALQWVPRIFQALEADQFMFYVQPIAPVTVSSPADPDEHLQKYEVLLRLRDESGRIIPPGDFIPVAEKYGLMHLIDRWVIRTLFEWLGKKIQVDKQAGTETCQRYFYSINLSGASLNDDQFLDFVQEQFNVHGIPPQMICFEVTETLAITNLNRATQLIRVLKSLGCYFALDDFGSGMSSFGYLKSLPIDFLKIDGIFIKDLLMSQVACEIVEAINRIAHVMEIQTIAEFVENDEILAKLQSLGVDYAQGYGIARPSALSMEL
jgi:diguanylate cyclase (GGDEF)-like protein/PAS domain S-box-containing protein